MASFLQSPEWETFQQQYGFETERIEGVLYIEKHMPLGAYYLSSRCELTPDFELPEHQPIFIRYEPSDMASFAVLRNYALENYLRLVKQPAVQPKQTSLVNLKKSDEELLAAMHSKHRYNIRVAKRHGVEIEIVSGQVTEYFDRFWKLMEDTATRQQFRLHPKEYYETMLETLAPSDMARLVFATRGGEDLATMLLLTYGGTATYLHGASSERHKNLMAPYLMHWEVMQEAKRLGLDTYDLWGTDAVFNRDHQSWLAQDDAPSYGTTRFKLGFGGTIVEYPGTYDLLLRPAWYALYYSLRKLRPGSKRAFS